MSKAFMLYALLLAGGHGTRLWPVSRKNIPKQLQPVLGDETLLKATWKRLRRGLPAARILVVTNAAQAELVRRDLPGLPEKNLLIEPMRRDTAAAIGFGAAVVRARDPRAIVMTVNSDAHVKNAAEYWRILKLAERVAKRAPRRLVLVGIRPTYPETGYGYIKMGSQAMRLRRRAGAADEVFEVEGFREKPDLETAKSYVAQWEYLWNPTLLVAEAGVLLDAYKKHLPAMWKQLRRIERSWRKSTVNCQLSTVLMDSFQQMTPISVDYGILEKERGMLVVPADFGWADVGHWRAVHEVLAAKPSSTIARGRHVSLDSEGNLLYSFTGKLIAAAGLKDMIVVETEDAILVCPKSRAQDVKKIVERLEKKKWKRYL